MATIFWVEDQLHWIERFRPVLEAESFDDRPTDVQVFQFAEAACQYIRLAGDDGRPDLALLDADMSGNKAGGFSVSRALQRKWPGLPVIYLSEHSGTGIEEQAFETADTRDFIAKHQRNIESVLCWRIRAVLRQRDVSQRDGSDPGGVLESGDLRIDTTTWELYWCGRKLTNPVNPRRPLAPMPRKILRQLVEVSPRPLSTWQMAERLGIDPDRFSWASYRQHVRTLRRSFDRAMEGEGRFTAICKAGEGIVALGDEEAYRWLPAQGTDS